MGVGGFEGKDGFLSLCPALPSKTCLVRMQSPGIQMLNRISMPYPGFTHYFRSSRALMIRPSAQKFLKVSAAGRQALLQCSLV